MITIAIVGGHGKIARLLTRGLAEHGHRTLSIIRNPEHAGDIVGDGGEPLLLDVESATVDQLASAFDGADAVVFAAGAGPDSGPERKHTVDYGASVLSAQAASRAGITRFVQISAMGIDGPVADDASEDWKAYVEAKREADAALRGSGLDWTIIRPGRLTDDEGTGHVSLVAITEGGAASEADAAGPRYGDVPRDDVAAAVAAVLNAPHTVGLTLDLVSGDTPLDDAVAQLAAGLGV
ncbi:SDR family oxidoreductase [Okibacterium endophyticum]